MNESLAPLVRRNKNNFGSLEGGNELVGILSTIHFKKHSLKFNNNKYKSI